MLIGGQENFALLLANLADHEKPRASFPTPILHPDNDLESVEGNR
jgi:hypothetical protein